MSIIIRKAELNDIETLSNMLNELFSIEDDFIPDSVKQKKGLELIISGIDGGGIFIAQYGTRVAGMMNLQKIVSTAAGGFSVLLEDLYVEPDMRGRGIGSMLINHAVGWSKEEQAVRIQLGADARNAPALGFYQSKGFMRGNLVLHYKYISSVEL